MYSSLISFDLGNNDLFEGSMMESKFGKWLSRLLQSLSPTEKMELGVSIEDLGTHSCRKGVATYVSSNPSGPSMVSIFLRAGWSLGNVQQRYIFAGNGADQLVGRCATGLNINENTFAILPPHFHSSTSGLSESNWQEIVPNYDKYPQSFRVAIPYLVASVVYHKSFLESTLPSGHILFRSRIFTGGFITSLSSKVLTGIGENLTSNMKANGIPPHMLISNRVLSVETRIEALSKTMQIDKNEIIEKIGALPRSVCEEMLNKFQINGAVPFTREMMIETMDGYFSEFRLTLEHLQPRIQSPVTAIVEDTSNVFQTFDWSKDGQMGNHPIPKNFRFPTNSDVKTMWDLWLYGDKTTKIQPYRFIQPVRDFVDNHAKKPISQSKKVINEIATEIFKLPNSPIKSWNDLIQAPQTITDRQFEIGFTNLINKINTGNHHRRIGELCVGTVYNSIRAWIKSNNPQLIRSRKRKNTSLPNLNDDDDDDDDDEIDV
jgi:hypothetical protein